MTRVLVCTIDSKIKKSAKAFLHLSLIGNFTNATLKPLKLKINQLKDY